MEVDLDMADVMFMVLNFFWPKEVSEKKEVSSTPKNSDIYSKTKTVGCWMTPALL